MFCDVNITLRSDRNDHRHSVVYLSKALLQPWVELWKHHWSPERSGGASYGGGLQTFLGGLLKRGPPSDGASKIQYGPPTRDFQLFH